jgi:hypothetical protein
MVEPQKYGFFDIPSGKQNATSGVFLKTVFL